MYVLKKYYIHLLSVAEGPGQIYNVDKTLIPVPWYTPVDCPWINKL